MAAGGNHEGGLSNRQIAAQNYDRLQIRQYLFSHFNVMNVLSGYEVLLYQVEENK